MMSFRGKGSWAKMMSPGGQQTVPARHPTKKVYKAVDPTHLSTKIEFNITCNCCAELRNSVIIVSAVAE